MVSECNEEVLGRLTFEIGKNMNKAIALNGSPRKNGNTATLLQKALAGAAEAGAETELIHLIDLDYKGCSSCFACKRKGPLQKNLWASGATGRFPIW